jgi:hypothetical protein
MPALCIQKPFLFLSENGTARDPWLTFQEVVLSKACILEPAMIEVRESARFSLSSGSSCAVSLK